MTQSVFNVFFSPTHSTEALGGSIARVIAEDCDYARVSVNLTRPENRPTALTTTENDIVVFSFPVYSGRVPSLLLESIAHLQGSETPLILVALYGNRDFDDALVEAVDLLSKRGYKIAAAGAFIAEHSMAPRVAAGRPDADDQAKAIQFGHDAAKKIKENVRETPSIKGNHPYRKGMPELDIRPQTSDDCIECGICVDACPLNIINDSDPSQIDAGCLQCHACVKFCPQEAKFFNDEQSNKVVTMLESNCTKRKEPELFL